MGSLKVACAGTQCLDFEAAWFRERFEREFGSDL
jgi:hypothetical protein